MRRAVIGDLEDKKDMFKGFLLDAWWTYRTGATPPEGEAHETYGDWLENWDIIKKTSPEKRKALTEQQTREEIIAGYQNSSWFHGGIDEPGLDNLHRRFEEFAAFKKGD